MAWRKRQREGGREKEKEKDGKNLEEIWKKRETRIIENENVCCWCCCHCRRHCCLLLLFNVKSSTQFMLVHRYSIRTYININMYSILICLRWSHYRRRYVRDCIRLQKGNDWHIHRYRYTQIYLHTYILSVIKAQIHSHNWFARSLNTHSLRQWNECFSI